MASCWNKFKAWFCKKKNRDGVQYEWATNDYAVYNDHFTDSNSRYTELLRQLRLSPIAKASITLRFVKLVGTYETRIRRLSWFVSIARWTMLLGGILLPSLIVAAELVKDQCKEQPVIPWISLIVSIATGASAGALENFSLPRRLQVCEIALRHLDAEGWNFYTLSGRYSKYKHHFQCWRRFMAQVEHINSISIDQTIGMAFDNDQEKKDDWKSEEMMRIAASVEGSMATHSEDEDMTGGFVIGARHPTASNGAHNIEIDRTLFDMENYDIERAAGRPPQYEESTRTSQISNQPSPGV